jgi:multidrug efflux pump subunit AcrA (membrane-fusion protein)
MMPELARAQGQLEGARLRAEAYAARLKQLEELRSEGLARGADLAEARARLAEAQAAAREADALIGSVESAGVKRHGKHYDVVAPLAGVVVAVNAPLGSTRGPSDGAVCTIAGGRATRVEARFGFDLPKQASYELWALGRRQSGLRLVAQAPEVSVNDATRSAWFELTDKTDLPQGTSVRVRMQVPEGTWVVPQNSLSQREPESVTTAHGSVNVEVLTMFGPEVLVRGALSAEDSVAEREVAP